MKVFVVNCGSSSIKYQLFDMTDESVLARGIIERIGSSEGASLRGWGAGRTFASDVSAADHTEGLNIVLGVLTGGPGRVLDRIEVIDGVGHRVVHGGEEMTDSVRIDRSVLETIARNAGLAPLHNPPNQAGIEAAMAVLPGVPHVAVFDTAFLSTLPARAYRYAVPDDWYRRHHVRRYGFHGTSHRYVTYRTAELLGVPPDRVNLITCHLGNGCSMTAVAGGKAVDHSMGLTPLEGLVMGTRSGDIDPAIIFYMQRAAGLSAEEVEAALNRRSGLLGVSGLSNDMRDLLSAAEGGHEGAAMAVELFGYRIVKYIGAYYAILPGCDAIVLTGGIGENSVPVRRRIVEGLGRLGVELDPERNAATTARAAGAITAEGAAPPVWVVPTDEELMIARDVRRVIAADGKQA